MGRNVRRALIAGVLAFVAAFGMSACTLPTLPLPFLHRDSTSTPTDEHVDPALAPFYHQRLVWTPCGGKAQCSAAKAPLDWSAPGSGDIELALVRYPATGTRYGSLFTNPGGPGGSGVDFVKSDPDTVVGVDVREHFDLIGWDPRGVGASSAVHCGTDAQLDSFFFDPLANEVNTPAGDAELVASTRSFVDACAKGTGPLLAHIDTESTTHDLDMLRAAVGDRKLAYFGYSYGSDIGALYAERFPDRVGRIVLDGATDSTLGGFETSLGQLKGFRHALEAYLADCSPREQCFFHGSAADGIAALQALFDRLDANPVRTKDGRQIDSTFLYTAIQTGLYSKDSWSYITKAVNEIVAGDPTTTTLLTDFSYSRDANGHYTDNSRIAFLSILCLDYPVATDPAEIERENRALQDASPFKLDQSHLGDVLCQNWPAKAAPRPPVLHGAGAAPILIVATTGDPATPYEWGVALSQQLESARLLTFVGDGHTAYGQGSACITGAVDRYLLAGVLPDEGTRCGS